jgi:Cof subfamily protein (haloacid dehalogenase superfamily)
MKYKLIAIDMDGTLLNSENKISERNKDILHRAAREGIHVVLSTGRILKSAQYYSKSIELKSPIVACNGAIVSSRDGKDIIYEKFIETQTSKKIIKLAEENNIYYRFYDRNTFYTKDTDKYILNFYDSYEDSFKKQEIDIRILKEPIELLTTGKLKIYKFVFIEENKDKLLDFRKKLEGIGGINVSSSWFNNIEVMGEGVSKGTGLKYLCEALNIDQSEIVAIGDNENDIPMFKLAGLAIAMKNGDEIIREYSHVITDTNNEDGVANAIEKYVLNR